MSTWLWGARAPYRVVAPSIVKRRTRFSTTSRGSSQKEIDRAIENTASVSVDPGSGGTVTGATPPPAPTLPTPSRTAGVGSSSYYADRASEIYDSLTGSEEIRHLKLAVADASRSYDDSDSAVRRMREDLSARSADHERLSRRHRDVMDRRHEWEGEEGVIDFARLTAEEGRARRLLVETRKALRIAEAECDRTRGEYVDALRRRYHEEQMWQERWRVLSTYGTWALIVINSAVFVVGQYLFYRREERRMTAIEAAIEGGVETVVQTVEQMNSVEMKMTVGGKACEDRSDEDKVDLQKQTDVLSSEEVNDSTVHFPPSVKSTEDEKGKTFQLEGDNSNGTDGSEIFPQKRQWKIVTWARKVGWYVTPSQSPIASLIHWPSAATGAIVASLAIGAVSSSSRK